MREISMKIPIYMLTFSTCVYDIVLMWYTIKTNKSLEFNEGIQANTYALEMVEYISQ